MSRFYFKALKLTVLVQKPYNPHPSRAISELSFATHPPHPTLRPAHKQL
ncbi:hypothetical protein CRENPOLYSF1_150090 [Crenothrix polyspora]|uniref:Uncharacterized protein n=1 Tax=Crenothrix polyspora TaxID=360316 RepID=A0A1R4H358_9GAMM|nr:hypothetical protein CRENPOLYSF1_150090 [Crenothrix polyspora]